MEQLLQDKSKHAASFSLSGSWGFIDLLRDANARILTITAIAVALAWVPPAVLSALRGGAAFVSFLTDYASQSRFLIILPVLILAAPNLHKRLAMVAHHFGIFVRENQLSKFHTSWTSFERLRNSGVAQAMIVLLTYATAVSLGQNLSPEGAEVVSWWKGGGGGFRWFSPAGTWALLTSYPILLFFTLLWLWRQLLWTRFMRSTARLDLRLIAAHPDCLGGLGFLEASLRGQIPFSFCLGAGLAGAVANRVLHNGQKLTAFGYVAAAVVGTVLFVCVAPYFTFTPVLMRVRHQALLRYGVFARAAGEQFEIKWLEQPRNLNQDVLDAADFSALYDLYGVVKNVNAIFILPVSRVDLYVLIAVAFVPAIPVVIASIPIDTVARAAIKMLF
jgi:hypothetical protein